MGSPNARARMQQIEEEIAAARDARREIFEREMKVDGAIREIETRYLADLYAESRAALLKRQGVEEKIGGLELELSRLKSQ